jgi:hypothetical protein
MPKRLGDFLGGALLIAFGFVFGAWWQAHDDNRLSDQRCVEMSMAGVGQLTVHCNGCVDVPHPDFDDLLLKRIPIFESVSGPAPPR